MNEDERASKIGHLTIEKKELEKKKLIVDEKIKEYRKALVGMIDVLDKKQRRGTWAEGRLGSMGGPYPTQEELAQIIEEEEANSDKLEEVNRQLQIIC